MTQQMSSVASDASVEERVRLVGNMMGRVRAIAGGGVTRVSLQLIKAELQQLAARRDLFPVEEFPPIPGGTSSMYRLSIDPDHRHALYAVAPAAGGFAPPHDHTTWAVIAGVHGREHNKLYRRLDDGSQPGIGRVEVVSELDIVAGTALAMMPDDIHSIHLGEDGPHVNLHLYGISMEHVRERKAYSMKNGTYKTFPPASGVRIAAGGN